MRMSSLIAKGKIDGAAFCIKDATLAVSYGVRKRRIIYPYTKNISFFEQLVTMDQTFLDSQKLQVAYFLYLYSLRSANTRQLQQFDYLSWACCSEIRSAVFNGPLMLPYKLATIECLTLGLGVTDLTDIQGVFNKHHLTNDDALLYILLYLNRDVEELLTRLYEVEEGCSLSVSAVIDEISAKDLAKFKKYSSFQACKKLHFIVKGNRLEHNDMIQELISYAIQSYCWVRPFYTKKHAVNYAIRSLQNRSNNIIREMTSPDRARIRNEGGTYINTIVALSATDLMSEGTTEDAVHTYIDLKRSLYADRRIVA